MGGVIDWLSEWVEWINLNWIKGIIELYSKQDIYSRAMCNKKIIEWLTRWIDEWMDDWMNEWMNELYERMSFHGYPRYNKLEHSEQIE